MLGLQCHLRSTAWLSNGELGPRYASAFEGMAVSTGGGRTEITGAIIDQSHLQGLLERVSGLGLTLYSISPLDNETGESGAPATRAKRS